MRCILHAAGHDPDGPFPTCWSPPAGETYVRETLIDGLGLTEAKCISVAETARRHSGAPVRGAAALPRYMARAALRAVKGEGTVSERADE